MIGLMLSLVLIKSSKIFKSCKKHYIFVIKVLQPHSSSSKTSLDLIPNKDMKSQMLLMIILSRIFIAFFQKDTQIMILKDYGKLSVEIPKL